MLHFTESAIEKHRLNADCYLNHFTKTRPYGMVPGSPRILIPASCLGLAFALPKTVIGFSKMIDVIVYDLYTGNTYKLPTSPMYHKCLGTRDSAMSIQNGIFHFNQLYAYGRFTPSAHLFLIVFNFEKLTWNLICVFSSDPLFPFPMFSTENLLHVITGQQETCTHWIFTADQQKILPPANVKQVRNVDLTLGDPVNTDIDGRCCLYDEQRLVMWHFYFCDSIMDRIYNLDIKSFLCNQENSEPLNWEMVNLKSNPMLACPSSIEYSKCFIRHGVVYWFVPEECTTTVWCLDLINQSHAEWTCLPEPLPFTVIHPAYDKNTDTVFMFCATVDQKSDDYPWEPCYLFVKRAGFVFPSLQQMSSVVLSANINSSKVQNHKNLIELGISPNLAESLWQRVKLLNCFNVKYLIH